MPTKAMTNSSLNIRVLTLHGLQPLGTYCMLPFAAMVTNAVPFTTLIDDTLYVTLPVGCIESVRQKAEHRFSTMRAAYCWLVAAIAIGVSCIISVLFLFVIATRFHLIGGRCAKRQIPIKIVLQLVQVLLLEDHAALKE